LEYSKPSGFGTPKNSVKFDVLGLFQKPDSQLAGLAETHWNEFLGWLKGVCRASSRSASPVP
jgi:hypothetical protein